eukprot:TRINITY_DN45018_c0_g1_i2.p1 TRINITY_DN45018_c0_g1~~TRINITY_DN45018_c0_g1_i2.p1  ORF type:complete len:197 (+),score=-27.16 TRINITY_DN45018_c0_g1_i2:911-1501(+)
MAANNDTYQLQKIKSNNLNLVGGTKISHLKLILIMMHLTTLDWLQTKNYIQQVVQPYSYIPHCTLYFIFFTIFIVFFLKNTKYVLLQHLIYQQYIVLKNNLLNMTTENIIYCYIMYRPATNLYVVVSIVKIIINYVLTKPSVIVHNINITTNYPRPLDYYLTLHYNIKLMQLINTLTLQKQTCQNTSNYNIFLGII